MMLVSSAIIGDVGRTPVATNNMYNEVQDANIVTVVETNATQSQA